MNVESIMLNVCECLNEHVKQYKELSEVDTSKMSFSEKMENCRNRCVLNGAIMAYKYVLALCEDRTMEGGEE